MEFAQAQAHTAPVPPDRRQSPALSLNLNAPLSSNNPFRNRAHSPLTPSPRSTPNLNSRPVSRNPFLAPFEADLASIDPPKSSPLIMPELTDPPRPPSQKKSDVEEEARRIFDNLTIQDKRLPPVNGAPPPPQRAGSHPGPHANGHRPSLSEEQSGQMRPPGQFRGPPRPRGPPGQGPPNGRSSPSKSENRRPRRNSESSMLDNNPDDEKRRRERENRRRERERSGKPRDSRSGSSKPKRPSGLDIIDKLDVTGIYGSGLFHHDGPFDACNPHRNRRKDVRAPMQAFPVNSANNTIGGSGPINKTINHDLIHGRGAEGFTDYNTGKGPEGLLPIDRRLPIEEDKKNFFGHNPAERETVHGEESIGLGTSTFLEGAPASRAAIQRHDSENASTRIQFGEPSSGGGLMRKKSLAQRIRGMSQSQARRTNSGDGDGLRSPNSRFQIPANNGGGGGGGGGALAQAFAAANGANSPGDASRPGAAGFPQSAGGGLKMYETNPFFSDYDDAYEKKSAAIKLAEQENVSTTGTPGSEFPVVPPPKDRPTSRSGVLGGVGRARAPSSPRRGMASLERRATEGGAAKEQPSEEQNAGLERQKSSVGSGFLNRVKSLKGGRGRREVRNVS